MARKFVTKQVDPFTGRSVPHSRAYWTARNAAYEKRYGPLNLTGPMGPSDVAKSIDAATRQKFGPQYQTLAKQTSASQQQDKNVTDWYGQYKAAIDAATAKAQASQTQAQNFTSNFANSSSALDAQQRGQLQQQQEQSAAQRGATVDPSQAFTGQQADQSRRQALGQFGAMQAQQGADTTAYMADKGRIASGAELQAHGAEATRRQAISELVRQLQGQEGDYRTTLRGQLQASERQNNLANATFGLNQAKAAASAATAGQTAAERAAAQRETARHNRATENNAAANRDAANRRAAARRGSGGGGGGRNSSGQTPTQARTWNDQFNKVYSFLDTRNPKSGKTEAQIIQGLIQVNHVPYSVAKAAYRAWLPHHKRVTNQKPADAKPGPGDTLGNVRL